MVNAMTKNLTQSELVELLRSVKDPVLVSALKELKGRWLTKFGLVWEPETAKNAERIVLPATAVPVKGSIVVRSNDTAGGMYRVESVEGQGCVLRSWVPFGSSPDGEVLDVGPVSGLRCVHVPGDLGNRVIPTLLHVETVRSDDCPSESPSHVLIEGENFHALQALTVTHEKKVDVIYIDPPYNTGTTDFVYNDRYVEVSDGMKHSSWLRFMEKRLRLALGLLSDTGIIFVAVDDNEQAYLRLLMDQIFGETNWISTMVWNGDLKNNSRFVSNSHDYMHVYAVNKATILGRIQEGTLPAWSVPKLGAGTLPAAATKFWGERGGDPVAASVLLKAWLKNNESKLEPGDLKYEHVDEHVLTKGPYRLSDLSAPGGGGGTYDVINPTTGNVSRRPAAGWRYSEETMKEHLAAGLIHFGDNNQIPCFKRYYTGTQTPSAVITQSRARATKRLEVMFGAKVFPFPKDHLVLADLIRMCSGPDATILDFFAGSGSTLHAVAELNAEDGGNRTCILVTNNSKADGNRFVTEGGDEGICRTVTVPRARKLFKDGWEGTRPFMQRCESFRVTYMPEDLTDEREILALL